MFNSSNGIDSLAMGKFSVIAQQILTIQQAKSIKAIKFEFESPPPLFPSRLILRNNQLKWESLGEFPIILEEYVKYTSNE
jgi:hypothetical protein